MKIIDEKHEFKYNLFFCIQIEINLHSNCTQIAFKLICIQIAHYHRHYVPSTRKYGNYLN